MVTTQNNSIYMFCRILNNSIYVFAFEKRYNLIDMKIIIEDNIIIDMLL